MGFSFVLLVIVPISAVKTAADFAPLVDETLVRDDEEDDGADDDTDTDADDFSEAGFVATVFTFKLGAVAGIGTTVTFGGGVTIVELTNVSDEVGLFD
jgi:hypothetical protein